MQKVNAKGQITIPKSQREAVGLEPGDEIETFVVKDQINVIKKIPQAAKEHLSESDPPAGI